MKNFTFLALLILFSLFSSAQMPQLQWANSLGEPAEQQMGIKLIPDNNGNLFFYGRFSGTVDFDPGSGVTNLTAGGNADIVIGKYDPSGGLIWVKKIGGSIIATNNGHTMVPYDATIDSSGNLYITGMYAGTVDIDPTATSYLLYPPPSGIGGERIFVASYTNNGDLRWGFGYGWEDYLGGFWNAGYSIKVDHAGDIIVSGMFHHSCDFDPSGATYELTASGQYMDIFFAKYSSTGNFIWAKSIFGGGVEDTPIDMIVDAADNIYLCGYLDIEADFDPSTAIAMVSSNGGGADAFLAKYNSSGEYQWAFSAGAAINYDVATCLAFDHDGNICMGGYFRGTVDFDPSGSTVNLTSAGTSSADAFISKYTADGNLLWAKSFGGNNHENLGSMIIDQYGRIIMTGDFWGSCDFDPSALTEIIDAGTAPNAAFTVQFDNEGTFLNVMPVYGTNGYLFDHSMVLGSNQMLYFTGGFEGTVDFDPSIANHDLTAGGTIQDIYMSKYQIGTAIIRGSIWNDINSNGIQEPGELGLPNIKAELIYDRNNNNIADPNEGMITTYSLADGSYEFGFVAQGNYVLRVLPQPGYTSTTPVFENADLTNGQIINNRNFGFASTLVPLVCANFSANQLNHEIKLQWKTLTEVNCKGFYLQRSSDAVTFQNIAWINAQGSSTGSFTYYYSDKIITPGNNYYYRLQQIDLAETGKYICTVLVVKYKTTTDQINIYPNPAADVLNISTNESYSRLIIMDIRGRKIKEMNVYTGNRSFQVSVKELNAGIYILKMYNKEGSVITASIVKK